MPSSPAPGDAVQTPFGKGIIREVRNHGRLLVDVQGRALELGEGDVSALGATSKTARRGRAARVPERSPVAGRSGGPPAELDLHGLTVGEAVARAEQALNDALLADAAELRLIHGRSGGRIRAALHQRLREMPSIRGFHLDPANGGVTIVRL